MQPKHWSSIGWILLSTMVVGCQVEAALPPRCGDGELNQPSEGCDGQDLGGSRCEDLGFEQGGLLRCSAGCQLDDTSCIRPCGEGVADPGQACDGSDLAGATCASLGHYRGTIGCSPFCELDDSACERCGDGIVQDADGEVCDGTNLAGQSCESLGYNPGVLACSAACQIDLSGCQASGSCGDGIVQPEFGEVCEGTEVVGTTCREAGAFTGTATCAACQVDLDACEQVVELGTGYDFTCALTSRGRLYCWGANSWGQLGIGIVGATRSRPQLATENPLLVKLSLGMDHACALKSNGHIDCWGHGNLGQIGQGVFEDSDVPTPVTRPAGVTFTDLEQGGLFGCALDQNGASWCWGSNAYGCLGNDSSEHSAVPTATIMPASTTWTTLSAGPVNVCAIDQDGAAWCWGAADDGVIGNGLATVWNHHEPQPVTMPEGHAFSAISVGTWHACALDTQGDAWCWGEGSYGELGDNQCESTALPIRVSMGGPGAFVSIQAGQQVTCALDTAGHSWCWGYGYDGELGTPDYDAVCAPVRSEGDTSFAVLSATEAHACAADLLGLVYCWGESDSGRLGTGSWDDAFAPTVVAEPEEE